MKRREFVGGLAAAIVTDYAQGLLTILFSVMLLPVVLAEIGGLAGMRETIEAANLEQDMLSLVAPGNIGAFYITSRSTNIGTFASVTALGALALVVG